MYYSDKPIINFEDDLLGRKDFAKKLGQAILSLTSNENITIGLYGKWGSGKTSILNLAIREITNLSNSKYKENKPLIMKFEPWNFNDTDNLILQFFKQLKGELKVRESKGFTNSIGEAIEAYSDALQFAEVIPQIGVMASLLKITARFTGKKMKGKQIDNSISGTKDKLIKALENQNKKIIVIIDDIDRLTNSQIRMIFQLVNQVAGLPNIIYLLSMDKEIVVRALENVQECNGEEYLEKIIQVPFFIPKIDYEKVQKLFLYKLDQIINEKDDVHLNQDYWSNVYHSCIKPFVKSIRDVNRIINSFKFKYNIVSEEVNFVDMIAITVIEVTRPKVHQWIIEHEEHICGDSNDYKGVVYAEQAKKKEKYIKEFSDIGGEETLKVITSLFPKIDKEVNNYYESISENELRKDLRIADVERFKLYFSLDISEMPISNSKLIKSFTNMNLIELNNLFNYLNIQNNIISYFKELNSRSEEVPIERIPIMIEAIYINMCNFKGEEWKSIISISAKQYAEWCVNSLFKRLTSNDEKYNILSSIIQNADFMTLEAISTDINRIELGYGRLAGKDIYEREQIISLNQLEEVENLFVNRIQELINDGKDILECNKIWGVIYLWKSFDLNTCKNYLDKILIKPENILKFIVRMSSEWTGTTGRGWTFNKKDYNTFITEEKIIDAIDKYFNGIIRINMLEQEEAKLASFILNKNVNEFGHVNENEAREYIKKIIKSNIP